MPTNPRTVAVVEDNASCRLALQRILYAHGYRVEAFESAEAYLAVADSSLAFCLVLDVQLGAGLTGFELAEDTPSLTNDGRPKRWVVVRPHGAQTGILLARADGEEQDAIVGQQAAGRVGFFLRVEDFDAAYARMVAAGVQFVTAPRDEAYGRVAVFTDIAGNKWDLLGPR